MITRTPEKKCIILMKCCLSLLILLLAVTACEKQGPETSLSPYEKGVSLAIDGKFEKAMTSLKKAVNETTPENPAHGSLKIVERVLSNELDAQAARDFFKGIKYANGAEMTLAFSYLTKAINRAPDFPDAYYERALVNAHLKLYDEAISDFTRTVELNPDDAPAYNNRGLAYARGIKEYRKAIADFTRAVEIDPDFAEAYDNRGIAYQMASDNKENACADWKQACELGRCRSFEIAKGNGYCS